MPYVRCRILALLLLAGAFAGCGNDGNAAPPAGPKVVPQEREAGPATTAEPWFVNVAEERGITLLNQTGKPRKKEFIMAAVGPGAATFDANGDGRMDFYIPNGNWLLGPQRDQFYMADDRPRNGLYIQQPDGTFRDEAKARGVDDDLWGFGACAADLDNDGDQDLLVSNLGPNRLYVNDGKGNFTDIAERAGVAGPSARGQWEWSSGIACADYDKDGRLDVYISCYADMFKWLRESSDVRRAPDGSIIKANTCDWQRLEVYCGPIGLPGLQDHLHRNVGGRDGELRFEDVTKAAGIHRSPDENGPLYGFQVLFTDLNKDGWLDIYVANDSVPSHFYESQRDGTFLEKAHEYGIAVGTTGGDLAGMGADSADINGDGWPDLHKTNFALQENNVYVAEPHEGRVTFRDYCTRTGLKKEVYNDLGWGVVVFDYDHDGDRDIVYANGHVYPEVDLDLPQSRGLNMSFDQLNQVFRNDSRDGRLRFTKVTQELGPGFRVKKCSRGVCLVDVDNDGDLDLLFANLNNTPDLLINRRGTKSGHWLMLTLVGNVAKKTNIEAIGSKVWVRAGENAQYFETMRGQGFLGCHDPRLHVGLGAHTGPVQVEIEWPNGDKTTHEIKEVDQFVEIRQK